MMDLWVMFLLGLVSSLHCVQMCGPIVISYSAVAGFTPVALPAPRHALTLLPQHGAYNLGRILTYTALGALAGLLGHSVDFMGRLAGITSAAIIFSGSLMVVTGLFMLRSFRLSSRLGSASLRITSRLLRPLRNLLSSSRTTDRFYLGLALGFLPCGLVYMALLRSVGTGGALPGALSMAAFGLGTSGALFALGVFSSAVRWRFNRFGTRIAAVSVIALGVFLLVRTAHPFTVSAGLQACHAHH
jgi:uncharacterized protein